MCWQIVNNCHNFFFQPNSNWVYCWYHLILIIFYCHIKLNFPCLFVNGCVSVCVPKNLHSKNFKLIDQIFSFTPQKKITECPPLLNIIISYELNRYIQSQFNSLFLSYFHKLYRNLWINFMKQKKKKDITHVSNLMSMIQKKTHCNKKTCVFTTR